MFLLFSTGLLSSVPSWVIHQLHDEHTSTDSFWLAERHVEFTLVIVIVVTFLFCNTTLLVLRKQPIVKWVLLSAFILGKVLTLSLIAILLDDIAPVQICLNMAVIAMALLAYSLSPHAESATTWGALLISIIFSGITWLMGIYAFIVQRHITVVFAVPIATFVFSQGMVYMSGQCEAERYGPLEKQRFYIDYHLVAFRATTTWLSSRRT